MPRYLIERLYGEVDEDTLKMVGARSKQIATEEFPEVTWEHSHVVVDENGESRTFCIYDAPNEDVVRKHAHRLGHHEIARLYEIGGDVSPADFPT